jgi:hypothetical protein
MAVPSSSEPPESNESWGAVRLIKRILTAVPFAVVIYVFGSGFIVFSRIFSVKGVAGLAVLSGVWAFFALLYWGFLQETGLLDKAFYDRWFERPIMSLINRIRFGGTAGDEEWESFGKVQVVDYADYLDSKEWADKRAYMLRTAEYRCQTCNSKGRLEVHHRTYKRIGREVPQDLTVLCRSCHEAVHANRRLVR